MPFLSLPSTGPFPAGPSYFAEGKGQVPDILFKFLSWLIAGDKGPDTMSINDGAQVEYAGEFCQLLKTSFQLAHVVREVSKSLPGVFIRIVNEYSDNRICLKMIILRVFNLIAFTRTLKKS